MRTGAVASRITDSNSDDVDPTARDQHEIGREMVEQSSGLGSVMAHAYRGELDQATTWRQHLDQATTWAVTVIVAILTREFSSGNNPHYILLVGFVVVTIFLGIEARRYRDYDVYRSRIRMLQQNLFANAFDPSRGVEHPDWRVELADDYRAPTLKVTFGEALANRLRRVYLALLGVLLAAWLFHITAFTPRQDWLATPAISTVPGVVVVGVVAVFFLVALRIAYWPRERHAKGEFREDDPEACKEDKNDDG